MDGEWKLKVGDQELSVNVPINIPFTFGTSIWTKTFTLSRPKRPAVAFLKFGGIVNSGEVVLNGTRLGPIYGFSETRFDVASLLNLEGVNVIEVTLDDRLTSETVPGGPTEAFLAVNGPIAYTFPVAWANRPGIIRRVSLIYSDSPLVADVKTWQSFNVGMTSVDLTVRVGVAGREDGDPPVTAQAAISLNGSVLGNCLALPVNSRELECVIRIGRPELWSPARPVLHDLSVALLSGGSGTDASSILDAGRDRIGFRKFEARGARFYLNGSPIFLKGVSRHDIYGADGFVANDRTIQEDLIRIRALGANFVRCIHYPPDESFVRFADEYGILVSEELPAWAVVDDPKVTSVAAEMGRSLAIRDVNRASVVMYLVASLNLSSADAYLGTLIPLMRSLDESRLISYVFDDGASTAKEVAENVAHVRSHGADFYCQNSYWHPDIYDRSSPAFPESIPMLATEWTGAEGSDRGGIGSGDTPAFPSSYAPTNGVYPESYLALKTMEAAAALIPYVCHDGRPGRCLAGTVYFNWQDIEWPGMPFFNYPNHYPMLRNGLVYEDRGPKEWPLLAFQYLMRMMP